MFVKQIKQNQADINPDYQNNTLTITLHTLSAPGFNKAAYELAQILNQKEMNFLNINFRQIFKTNAH